MKLCSACLLGAKCAYDGEDNLNKKVLELLKDETLDSCLSGSVWRVKCAQRAFWN